MSFYGIEALLRVVSHTFFIYFAFWALQSLKLDHLFKKGHEAQIKFLYILLSVALGYISSSCMLEITSLLKNFMLTVVQK